MFGSSSSKKMEEQLFNLKFTAKQLARESKKCEKEEKAERLKVKKAIEKGNHEGAKIYAQNAIRQKNQAMNMLRLSSRVDAVASRLESAIRIGSISQAMTKVIESLIHFPRETIFTIFFFLFFFFPGCEHDGQRGKGARPGEAEQDDGLVRKIV